ncbi:YCF48-related protein [Algoriphagus sp. CAU 1675]|uniref:WD40/YVTN/BNR-like repeat-containing protein n=1 Tax=Algoriphagus sp. CAU 1675 TaxID=3032597 RepID=UPI0023DAFFFB|nr:YCF48-related protein [Algoriphagus sp. CAU 1675]MDF2156655.1 YCF48-related protein [Algoriphagus sp. CAU 1675]
MIRKNLLALSVLIALFSCQKAEVKRKASAPSGWEIFEAPVKASLRGLAPVDEDVAWASGSGGTWLRTIDGGKSWEFGVIDGLDTVDFRSIYAFDAEKAVAVSAGQPAVIYKTTDGGKTWELKHQESKAAFLDGISFANSNRGYVFGDPVDGKWMILETLDQGESWKSLDSLPEAAEGEAGFAASASSLLAEGDQIWLGSGGSFSALYSSADKGKSWEKIKNPLIQGESSQGVFALTSLGKGRIVAVGGDFLKENSKKGNLGLFDGKEKTWLQTQESPEGYRSGVAYFPEQDWVITVGPSGGDFSKDGGLNWLSLSEEGFHSVKLSNNGKAIWASGGGGKIAKMKY